jgi:hypothetical protein
MGNAHKVLFGKPTGKKRLGKSRRRWKDNIKSYLKQIQFSGVDWLASSFRILFGLTLLPWAKSILSTISVPPWVIIIQTFQMTFSGDFIGFCLDSSQLFRKLNCAYMHRDIIRILNQLPRPNSYSYLSAHKVGNLLYKRAQESTPRSQVNKINSLNIKIRLNHFLTHEPPAQTTLTFRCI